MTTTVAEGRKAIVTGAASGFGLEITRHLVRAGAKVALLDVDAARLEKAAAEVGHDAFAVQADVSSRSAVEAATERAITRLGGLDTLVICAGVIHIKPLAEVTEQDWDRTLDINLKGAFLCCQAAAPALKESGRGRIVSISSDAGRRGFPWIHAYCASKFGLIALTESLAAELAPSVTVNSVCPIGVPTTGMGREVLSLKEHSTGKTPREILADVVAGVPLQRAPTETDIANAVMFFISEAGAFLTGVSLDVDGGARLSLLPGTGS